MQRVLAMTMVVRDEEEILAANLAYHQALGVDVVLVIDHGSSDATPEILERHAKSGVVRWWRDEERAHLQADRVSRLLAIARDDHGAAWVIHSDADEFWMPIAGSLRDVFGAVPDDYGWLRVPRSEFLPVGSGDGPFHERIVHRPRRSLNLRGTALEPKVAQRPEAADRVAPGNHDLIAPRLRRAPDIGSVEVLHFPMRSYAQFMRKVLRNGIGHEANADREHPNGIDQLALLDALRAGRLPERWEQHVLDPGAGEHDELIRDERLRHAFAAATAPDRDSPAIADGFRRAYASHTERDAAETERDAAETARAAAETERAAGDARARAEYEAALAELTVAIERGRDREQALERSLEAIRGSATMRYTARARRLYHRLRDVPGGATDGDAVN